MDYWESLKVMQDFEDFKENWYGCMMCACDHGCNGWLLQNAGKALRVFEAVQKGATPAELDAIVQQNADDVYIQIRKEMWERK